MVKGFDYWQYFVEGNQVVEYDVQFCFVFGGGVFDVLFQVVGGQQQMMVFL